MACGGSGTGSSSGGSGGISAGSSGKLDHEGDGIDPRAVLFKKFHPTGEECPNCPACCQMAAVSKLQKIANHPCLLQVRTCVHDNACVVSVREMGIRLGIDGRHLVRARRSKLPPLTIAATLPNSRVLTVEPKNMQVR